MFVTTFNETEYIQRANAVLRGVVGTESGYVFLGVPEWKRDLPLWCENHRAFNAVKTVDGIRRVLGAPLNAVD